MESGKLLRTKNEVTEEAKEISKKLVKILFTDYKKSEENQINMDDAFALVEDLAQINEILQRVIERRNESYIKK
jgi:hypothetical protein